MTNMSRKTQSIFNTHQTSKNLCLLFLKKYNALLPIVDAKTVSDDDVWHSKLLGFWTLFIVRYPEEHKVSETGSAFVLNEVQKTSSPEYWWQLNIKHNRMQILRQPNIVGCVWC
jgi:hypothetical protein